MIRLGKYPGAVWLTLDGLAETDVRLKARPATLADMTAAQSMAKQLLADQLADLAGKNKTLSTDQVVGAAFQHLVQSLGVICIEAWEGVVTEDGQPAPCDPDHIKMLLLDPIIAGSFFKKITARYDAIASEGKG